MEYKVLILSVADLRHMTVAGYYYEELYKRNISFDIICTNRYKTQSSVNYPCKIYSYSWVSTTYQSKLKKIIPFIKFRKYALNIIKKNHYSHIIVWGENTGILFNNFLLRKYKNKYYVNIRDIDIFYIPYLGAVLRKIEQKTITNACFYTAPAPRGLIFKHKNALLLLNQDYATLNKCYMRTQKKEGNKPLILTYMGLINQYMKFFLKIIDVFANDRRFLLRFYGEGAEKIQRYIESRNIINVEVQGAFVAEKTSEYLNQTDMIFSAYGRTNFGVDGAIGVKESYGPPLRIPVISDNYGMWYKISKKYGLGFGIDENKLENEPDRLYDWYMKLDFKQFEIIIIK